MNFFIIPIVAILLNGCTSAPRTLDDGAYRDVAKENAQPYHYRDKVDEFDEERLLSSVVDQIRKCLNPEREIPC